MKKVFVIYFPGTNCEEETMQAFKLAGAKPELLFIQDLRSGKKKITDCDICCFPGGFSFGDHVGAGAVAATLVRDYVPELLKKKIPTIGICNGFQIMVRAGMFGSRIALTQNDSRFFSSVPVKHEVIRSNCIWTRKLAGEVLSFPAAHGHGKLVGSKLSEANIVMNYIDSPNGGFTAALSSANGLLLGLMDHPERPYGNPDGLKLFYNITTEV